jgi:hypothetical protein
VTQWWKSKIDKFFYRSWDDLKDIWLDYIPDLIQPGSAPEHEITDSIPLLSEFEKIENDKPYPVSDKIPEVMSAAMHQGIFLLHKAANVIGASQIHIREGIKSWSLSSAYHAAFFSMKAVLHFLGVIEIHVPERGYFLLDLWSEEVSKSSRIRKRTYSVIKIIKSKRFDHQQLWDLFQRMLRITNFSEKIITAQNVASIQSLKITDFALQRNRLHYSTKWIFDDIRDYIFNKSFGVFQNELSDGSALQNPNKEDFSLALGFILVRMGFQMLSDIAELSPEIKNELDLLSLWFSKDCNYLYKKVYS